MRHHSAVELAQRAEAKTLICRQRDPLDHRRVHLQLTAHGRQQLEVLTREHLARIPTLAESLERVVHPRDGANGPDPDSPGQQGRHEAP